MAMSTTASGSGSDTDNKEQARDAVFGTYELLESILLYLKAEDLLFAAKVNRTWHGVDSTSTPIFERMQNNLAAPCGWDQPHRGVWYVSKTCMWARIFIYRAGNSEAIALFPYEPFRSKPADLQSLPRLVIVDGSDATLQISWDIEVKAWLFRFHHEATGIAKEGVMVSQMWSVDNFVRYLEEFHMGD